MLHCMQLFVVCVQRCYKGQYTIMNDILCFCILQHGWLTKKGPCESTPAMTWRHPAQFLCFLAYSSFWKSLVYVPAHFTLNNSCVLSTVQCPFWPCCSFLERKPMLWCRRSLQWLQQHRIFHAHQKGECHLCQLPPHTLLPTHHLEALNKTRKT